MCLVSILCFIKDLPFLLFILKLVFLQPFELFGTGRCLEPGGVHKFKPLLLREKLCTFSHKQDMTGFQHHQPGGRDGMFDPGDTCYCSGHQRASIHDGGIHLGYSNIVVHSSFSSIEESAILHEHHYGFYRIQTTSSLLQDDNSHVESFRQLLFIL